jgi:hypothetical protein
MSLLLVPGTRSNLEKSIENSVDLEYARKYLDEKFIVNLLRQSGNEGIRCWAMTKKQNKLFGDIKQGDEVLISESGTGSFTHYGVIIGKTNNAKFGLDLWPKAGENPWENIYFLANIKTIHINKKELVTSLGYKETFTVSGSMMVNNDKYNSFGSISKEYVIPVYEYIIEENEGIDFSAYNIESKSTRRQGHYKFANQVKENYNYQCAVCGIAETEFLVAGHISTWAEDKDNRLNPSNGICLCSLHDKAFEHGYIAVDKNYNIIINEKLKKDSVLYSELLKYDKKQIRLPIKGKPDIELLNKHQLKHGFSV